ncbi:ATP-dependent nuclease [Pseudomonas putida]|uniref:ATP-binding protein n=1 Tax=Pseudomonas putida TaxID=303 RepID=A0A8I1EGT9_PSEPU|nr:AAA family ATPase [Pseudomonas putida]MBI6884974.1 ATP-binding protein [Pseudomonas putida]
MRIANLVVQNFRGLRSLIWQPGSQAMSCIIGPGDSAKTTVLDAIEATLSPRWITFSEPDFYLGNSLNPITIEVTIAELSKALLSDQRFGLYIRGLADDGTVYDEPEAHHDPALTIRLTVDATMEPVWELICDRYPTPRVLSNRDRSLFGVVRLAGEEARHLTWGQGSVLARMTGNTEGTANQLAEAYRVAKQTANLSSISSLVDTAKQAEQLAKQLGAYVIHEFGPDLELGRGGFSSGSIALHDGTTPLRMSGLGTRRLATLAIQRAAIKEGAIVLVDEIEQGLEPHRVLGAVSALRSAQELAKSSSAPTGQLLITTHSEVVLSELKSDALFIMRRTREGDACIRSVPSDSFSRILKHAPRALFAKRILVCEGATELGLMLGLRELFRVRHADVPIEHLGVAIIDGSGAAAPGLAMALAGLGYSTALFRDSDQALKANVVGLLQAQNVQVFEYGELQCTEMAIFRACWPDIVDKLIHAAVASLGEATIFAQLRPAFPGVEVTAPFATWLAAFPGAEDNWGRIANLAIQFKWFKSEERGRAISAIVDEVVQQGQPSPLSGCIGSIERWVYAQ